MDVRTSGTRDQSSNQLVGNSRYVCFVTFVFLPFIQMFIGKYSVGIANTALKVMRARKLTFTLFRLEPVFRTSAKSADPDQTPQNVASDQG